MREPPTDISENLIAGALSDHYGITVDELVFLPLGADSWAWTYRVRGRDGNDYFAKIRKNAVNEPGLKVPHFLYENGIKQVIAPLATANGALWADVSACAVTLYPFFDGGTGKHQGMTPVQWIAKGRCLRRMHDIEVPEQLKGVMRSETFEPVGVDVLRELGERVKVRQDDPIASELADFWNEQLEAIELIAVRAVQLGKTLAKKIAGEGPGAPNVICHADIHTNNVMVNNRDEIAIVDWDEAVLAPRERDLMFVLGGGICRDMVSPEDENLFLQGYGAADTDPLALAYYRFAWALGDISEYASQVLSRPDLGPLSRQTALERFKSLFLPGNIVETAVCSPLDESKMFEFS